MFLLGHCLLSDLGFQLYGNYSIDQGKDTAVLTGSFNPTTSSFAIDGWRATGTFNGSARNTGLKWRQYGCPGVAQVKCGECPGEPAGIQCGYQVQCPAIPPSQWPTECLHASASESVHHGCRPWNTTNAKALKQCEWSSISDAQAGCGNWPECEAIYCIYDKWQKTTKCYARGNGTKVEGGGAGDQTDISLVKEGNMTGVMHFSPSASADFVLDITTGAMTFSNGAVWQHAAPITPAVISPMCAKLGCITRDPKSRCNCDPACMDRSDCCPDYAKTCEPPTPRTPCNGSTASANLPLAECAALQGFYDATNGTGWRVCARTFRRDPCGCDFGVPRGACGGDAGGVCCEGGHVTEIYLGDNRLGGTLSAAASLKPLTRLRWLNLACNSIRGKIDPHFLDWPTFRHGDDDRNDQCQLESPDGCAARGLPANRFECPVPPGAKADCFAECITPPAPVPSECVRVAVDRTSNKSKWVYHDHAGVETYMDIIQGSHAAAVTAGTGTGAGNANHRNAKASGRMNPPPAPAPAPDCSITLTANYCDFPPCVYWSPSSGTVDTAGRMTMTLMKYEVPLKGQVSTTDKGTRAINWANGAVWYDCASPGAPDCTM